jgi:UDP-glucose 4-epimerase
MLTGKKVVVTGGTGSLGKILTRRLLSGELGVLNKLVVFSRDEAKQHEMRLAYMHQRSATEEVIYRNSRRLLEFRIGDIRDARAVGSVLRDADVVFNAAAMKQVPTCEYFPYEGVLTNIVGAENIVRAIQEHDLPVQAVIGISTDKACKPVNVMGMTKAIQERIFGRANLDCRRTKFVCARYGNVLASRGSVIPLFRDQIARGGPVTITHPEMTRFVMSLDQAVDTIFAAVRFGGPGETYIPKVQAARVIDVAKAMIGNRPVDVVITSVRPGEKMHEILVSEEEGHRTYESGSYYVIQPVLPELRSDVASRAFLASEYSSADSVIALEDVANILSRHGLLADVPQDSEELLR